MTPAVSVVMAVYNGERFLPEVLRSLWAQTCKDFEVVVVDDGSSDRTPLVLSEIEDPRLRSFRRRHWGLTVSLDFGCRHARAPLIARLDADDLARPERLARQIREFDRDPQLGLCGTWTTEIDEDSKAIRALMPPCEDAALRRRLIRANPFVHSSVMFKRELFEKVGGYDARYGVGQDWDLWLRMAQHGRLACVNRMLTLRRIWPGQISQRQRRAQQLAGVRARWAAIRRSQYSRRSLVWCAAPLLRCAFP